MTFLNENGSLGWLLIILASTLLHGVRALAGVEIRLPDDGAWPRDMREVTVNAPNDFTINAAGHDRYLLVELWNNSSEAESVTLRGFLRESGARCRIEEGRIVREGPGNRYLYLRSNDVQKGWQRVEANEIDEAGTGIWSISIPPGQTFVSTVVAFQYQDYLKWIESLPKDDSRLRIDVVASSDNGKYSVHRIRITDPGSKRDKLKIALVKTAHAYEKSGFFLTQGAIEWLLSGDPAANLSHIEWTFYPCLDTQATHDGCNYVEQVQLVMDDGKLRGDVKYHNGVFWDPKHGEIPSQHYHVITDIHMWELQDCESYKYNP